MVHLFVCSQQATVLRADQEEKLALVLLPSAEGNKVCREQEPKGTRDLEEL